MHSYAVASCLVRSSIESEPALVLGPLRSQEEQRHDQQVMEIQQRRQERERRAAEEDGAPRDDSPPILEKPDDLTGPFHYEFSYWARSGSGHVRQSWFRNLCCFATFTVQSISSDKIPRYRNSIMLGGNVHFLVVCFCRAGEKITVTPSSKELLFYPPEVEATITGGKLLNTSFCFLAC